MASQFLYKSYNKVPENLTGLQLSTLGSPDNGIRLRSDLDFAGTLHHASCRSCEVIAALEDVVHQIKLLS
jgi:hypothetical protein